VRVTAPPDPYTQGDAAALRKAGYESLGPFPFGTGHDSRAVTELLGTEPLVWIETAHFRIGCSLSTLSLKNEEPWRDEWLARLRPELKRLAAKLPRVRTDVKELDPWLRAHLFAQRAEELYAQALANFGLAEFHFPVAPDDPKQPATFRGGGRHFGMREKFTVLLVRRAASHARYTRAYQPQEIADPVRYHDAAAGSMYWGASEDTAERLFAHDWALQSHFTFNVAHNLYTCYRGYGHDLPAWLITGLAHWHARAVSPRFPTYDRKDDADQELRSGFWEWDKRVPGLLKNGAFEPVATLLDREHAGAFGLEQHMQAWALVDHLMTAHREKFMQFVHTMKDPFHGWLRSPTFIEVRIRQNDALVAVLGRTPEQLETGWRTAVLGRAAKPPRR
jgi:hypothetical protein